jgi:hypothetical protein
MRTLEALAPYRQHVVLVGGFARDFYRLLPGFDDLGLVGAETLDVDMAISDPLQLLGEQRLHTMFSAHGLAWKPRLGLQHQPIGGAYFPAELAQPRP